MDLPRRRAPSRFRPPLEPLTLPFPVVEVWFAPDQVVERLVVASPDADLVAVGVLDDPELVPVRKEGDADGLVAGVVYAVRAGRPYREAHDIARFQSRFAFRSPKRRRSSNDDQPLLVAPVEVVRANRLARRELVDRHPDPGRTKHRPELRRSGAKSRRVTLVTARGTAKEVERFHRASMNTSSSRRAAACLRALVAQPPRRRAQTSLRAAGTHYDSLVDPAAR